MYHKLRELLQQAEDHEILLSEVVLQNEIEQQGLAKYLCGEYTLNKLNHNGQRINITIEIPRKDQSGTVTFTSGWMVEPKGKIRLATPYGDK